MSSALDLGSIETAGGDIGSDEASLTVPRPAGETTEASILTLPRIEGRLCESPGMVFSQQD